MRKNCNIAILIVSLILCYACSDIFMMMLGMSEPHPKNIKKLQKYYSSVNSKESLCYYISYSAMDSLSQLPYKPGWSKGFRPIQFKVFDDKGKLICQYASCEGSLEKLKILKSYPPKNADHFPFDTNYTFHREKTMIRSLCKDNAWSHNSDGITFVVYWGTWLGVPGKKLLKKVYDYASQYSSQSIKIIPVNLAEMDTLHR
ncbi:MAG: hypothetical protein KatS3mg028_0444 [Bacteroidia bacterium]|nr:MAG: hypothetical protein KatS3mg028_0444 [Bacteroidia bacterium]